MDKLEGNCVENNQSRLNMQTWINSLIQLYITPEAQVQSAELIQRIFQAIEQGDSCITCHKDEALLLQKLVHNSDPDALEKQAIAPFIWDDQRLYLCVVIVSGC